MSPTFDVVELATTYANKSAQDILKLAFAEFGDELWISFSGAEDVVLVDMAWKLNKNVKVFSLDTGAPTGPTFTVPRLGAGLAFSPDGRLLAAGIAGEGDAPSTGHVRVWSVADSGEAALLAVPSTGADAIAFSPDGRWLAAGPVVFDASGWRPAVQLPSGHTGDAAWIAALAFGPDPTGALALLLATNDGVLLRVDPDPATWLGQACAYAGRDLTPAQWQTYLPGRPYRQVCPS